jgi:hypothetical protein
MGRPGNFGIYNADGKSDDETIKSRLVGTFMIRYIPLNSADGNLYIVPTKGY